MRFETKIAVALREDLPVWQKLNMTAFLVSGIVATQPETVGENYVDGSGTAYLPMFRQPVLVFAGSADALAAAYERAMAQGSRLSIFTDELFSTDNDADNRAAVRACRRDHLKIAGFALHDNRKTVDKVLKGLTLHP